MVAGLHDKRWLPNVLNNYARQTYKNKRLLIVENGNGIGCASGDFDIIKSDPGCGQYINAAIAWLRANANPNDWFCKCDADDYYGPKYLAQISKPVTKGKIDYLGRKSLYIRTTENRLWYAEAMDAKFIFHGPTLAARIKDTLDFPLVTRWGEDGQWCRLMNTAGKISCSLPAEGVCYQRWSEYSHTWPCTDEELRTLWQVDFQDLGEFDEDVVNGIVPRKVIRVLPVQQITPDNFMPFRLLREQGSQGVNYIGTV